MGRNIDDIIQDLPAERQTKIANLADEKIKEMLAHASTLTDFRKAVGKTQSEVAKELGINQNAVSQLEKRSDTYVSTLRRFLRSLGMTLELSVVAKNGVRIDLPNFLQSGEYGPAANGSKAFAGVPAAQARKPVAKVSTRKAMAARKIAAKAATAKKTGVVAKPASGTAKKKTSPSPKHASALQNK
jgi:transcriptional regulator with XRE-family HTH domain